MTKKSPEISSAFFKADHSLEKSMVLYSIFNYKAIFLAFLGALESKKFKYTCSRCKQDKLHSNYALNVLERVLYPQRSDMSLLHVKFTLNESTDICSSARCTTIHIQCKLDTVLSNYFNYEAIYK